MTQFANKDTIDERENMKKIAVCLPSYNESGNISKITTQIDQALSPLLSLYKCTIVNCDNNSPDYTNKYFCDTQTVCSKYSILSDKIGKGVNILNFIRYCEDTNVDYAFMFDSDLTSFQPEWIEKMLNELKIADFVTPLYKRKRYEGNTTNHFVFPLIYSLYGVTIRQPIGGDYAFNKKYINLFCQLNHPSFVQSYGIDIYMLLCALKNVTVSQVELGYKKHAPSDHKMLRIFNEVVNGFTNSMICFPPQSCVRLISTNIENYISIDKRISDDFYKRNVRLKINKETFEDCYFQWKQKLKEYIIQVNCSKKVEVENFALYFDDYVKAYWKYFEKSSVEQCEHQIYRLANDLKKEMEGEKDAIDKGRLYRFRTE